VLLGSAVITAAMQHFVDMAVILAVVIANAVIGFIQEGKAEKAMESIRKMLAPQAAVLRDGERHSIDGAGWSRRHRPAGGRRQGSRRPAADPHSGLQIQEAILTGESVPADKATAPVAADAALGDRSCMAFSGTMVTSGQGSGVVAATGADTEIGRISGLLADVEVLTTPLVRQMNVFAKWLTVLILLIAAILLVFGYFVEHHDFTEMFMAVVGLSVAAIPEGLPAVLTITLAVGVQAMARRNAIVRRLPAIETLGSVSVICTDKTGTLTRNEMMVASVALSGHRFSFEGSGYEPDGAVWLADSRVNGLDHLHLAELARAAASCNDASLHRREGFWAVEGDPMEGALLALAGKVGVDVSQELSARTRTDEIPFDSRHKFMATLHHDRPGHADIFVKGAPEQVLAMCAEQRSPSGAGEPLDEAYWMDCAEDMAAHGQRVLAIATRQVGQSQTTLISPMSKAASCSSALSG
jgi:magnesium-transporting ATPase (P-type)